VIRPLVRRPYSKRDSQNTIPSTCQLNPAARHATKHRSRVSHIVLAGSMSAGSTACRSATAAILMALATLYSAASASACPLHGRAGGIESQGAAWHHAAAADQTAAAAEGGSARHLASSEPAVAASGGIGHDAAAETGFSHGSNVGSEQWQRRRLKAAKPPRHMNTDAARQHLPIAGATAVKWFARWRAQQAAAGKPKRTPTRKPTKTPKRNPTRAPTRQKRKAPPPPPAVLVVRLLAHLLSLSKRNRTRPLFSSRARSAMPCRVVPPTALSHQGARLPASRCGLCAASAKHTGKPIALKC